MSSAGHPDAPRATDSRPVVVVTPNPAVDVTYTVDEQQLGVTQRVRSIARRPGGKGVNVASVLAALDVPTIQVLPLGGASGAWIGGSLRAAGFDVRVAPVSGDTRSTVTVVDDHQHPTLFAEAGPTITAREWVVLTAELRDALRLASHLVISGSFPPSTPDEVVETLVRAGVEAGVPVVVDVSGPALLAAARSGATIVKPNLDEAMTATGESDLESARTALLELGARTVVISRGADGLTSGDGDSAHDVPAVPGVTGNPTGAGDATTAALVAALRAGLPLPDALRRAAAAGAAAVLEPVAGAIDLEAFHRFLGSPPHPTGAPA
ncbi:hexose kinase [Plantibacter flavus]|uniref:1-phosphofructokinase family hexose kinase n=1 Tax=Plantibacter flavus TaxID=150123 RepID=UPI003F14BF28